MNQNKFKIVLFEPKIPQNTGNIARLCACTDAELHLVGPLGFQITDKYVKRAGLDYWDSVTIVRHDSLDELLEQYPESNFYFLTTKTNTRYTEINFSAGDFIVFGSETAGLPQYIHDKFPNQRFTIPMKEGQRSLNLANSVAIVLYEAIRQTNYLD